METNDDLTGSYVLVHPELYDDPVNRQGQLGILTFADPDNDEFFVSFGKDTALYGSDALMVLRDHGQIYGSMMNKVKDLEKEHIKDILRITMLLESRQPKDYKTALEMAAADEVVRSYALETLEEKLARENKVDLSQTAEIGTSRGR